MLSFYQIRKTLIHLIASLCILSSCQSRRDVVQIWDYINEHPDSALTVLNTMNASDFHGRTQADYRLLKAMALDKNYVDVASDSLAKPAFEFFRRYGPKDKEMMSLYYLALSHYYSIDFSNAIILLEEQIAMANELKNHLYAGLGHMLQSSAFTQTYCISEAVKSAELGVSDFEAINDTFQIQRAKLQLADSYHSIKDFEKAIDIFQELINTCQKDTFTMRRALIHGGYSYYLAQPERADLAMRYYEQAINEYKAQLSPVEVAHFGEVACMAGNTQLARQIVKQLRSSSWHPEQRAFLEYKIYVKEKKYDDALAAVEDYLSLENDILVSSLEQSLVKSQRDYHQQQKQAYEHALHLTRWLSIACILCLVISIFSVFLFYSKKQKNISIEREQLIRDIGETSTLLHESEQKNSDLEQKLGQIQKRYIDAYKKKFSKISSIIENYYSSSGKKNSRDIVYSQVMDIASTIGRDQTRMSVLEKDVNTSLDNAMKWYRIEFPDNSVAHYNMVCLFMAGFTTAMIELLTSTPRNTLYSKKSRLIDKIQNSSAEHKDLFLMVIK